MDNRITSEEVANQFAKAIKLYLEWSRQNISTEGTPAIHKGSPYPNTLQRPIQKDIERMYKAPEVASILGVSKSAVYRMMKTGEITCFKMGPGTLRIRQRDLDAFINKD